ncbi:MAG: BON domain-containing protein [Terriglobales bacterium]
MKAKSRFVLALFLALGIGVACTRAPNDAQVANQVQQKIAADGNVQNKQIGVQSANGVVTLSGTVASEMERSAVANDAAQVAGVKTVVNNLELSPATTAQSTPPVAETPAAASVPTRRREAPPRRTHAAASGNNAPASTYAAPASDMASSNARSAPAAPAAPRVVTVPEGTIVAIRLVDPINTAQARAGDTFRATVSSPVMVGDETVIPADADVEGQIVNAASAGHFTGQSALALTLSRLRMGGKTYTLRTNQYDKQGSSRGQRTAATVGGGAALGAIIGGIAGGGKGAAIGAGVGAGAGTGVQAATKGQQIELPSETVLNFRLESALNVTPAATSDRNAGRQRVDQ